jgi:hypothetical protein
MDIEQRTLIIATRDANGMESRIAYAFVFGINRDRRAKSLLALAIRQMTFKEVLCHRSLILRQQRKETMVVSATR